MECSTRPAEISDSSGFWSGLSGIYCPKPAFSFSTNSQLTKYALHQSGSITDVMWARSERVCYGNSMQYLSFTAVPPDYSLFCNDSRLVVFLQTVTLLELQLLGSWLFCGMTETLYIQCQLARRASVAS